MNPKPVKNYKYSKTTRRPYTGSKKVDASCRSHGGCPYCKSGREHKYKMKKGTEE